jgi:hypothetical protein
VQEVGRDDVNQSLLVSAEPEEVVDLSAADQWAAAVRRSVLQFCCPPVGQVLFLGLVVPTLIVTLIDISSLDQPGDVLGLGGQLKTDN